METCKHCGWVGEDVKVEEGVHFYQERCPKCDYVIYDGHDPEPFETTTEIDGETFIIYTYNGPVLFNKVEAALLLAELIKFNNAVPN